MNPPFRLDGKTALVTGGASGIGEAICRVLAAAGASVIVVDLNGSAAEQLAAQLPNGLARQCDIAQEHSVRAMYDGIDKLDVLVNNAGIGHVGGIEETNSDDFARLYNVNVSGTFLVTKYAVPLLIASKGNVVNIGSVAGLVGIKKRFAYCATKGAVVMMTRQLALDYAQQFRVNCICPGTVDSPFVESYLEKFHKHEKEAVREQIRQRQPVGRLGQPVEVAHLTLYMASEEAAYMTGSVVSIDGGWTAA
ncbi:MAG TPA: SDR family NAD(P)-dependent oxidoreductase [Bryobacteraceae bacterium]|nr:SDR family NAD(P)-dependent oxidoreductase [Bryobacteraceae bacterium]